MPKSRLSPDLPQKSSGFISDEAERIESTHNANAKMQRLMVAQLETVPRKRSDYNKRHGLVSADTGAAKMREKMEKLATPELSESRKNPRRLIRNTRAMRKRIDDLENLVASLLAKVETLESPSDDDFYPSLKHGTAAK